MNDTSKWKEIEQRIASAVKLPRRPVAVSFLDAAPANVQKFSGSEPSGCSYWRLAAEGRVFYTVPEDHFNCAVGACAWPPKGACSTPCRKTISTARWALTRTIFRCPRNARRKHSKRSK